MPDYFLSFVERLRKEIKTRQEQLTQVITGDVKEITTYKYVLGQLHAWNKIDQELTNLLKKQELDDDQN
jgi:DNA-binding transcriptional MocR family regulator|tara:strand:+ start:1068 stop:1274 length:207 start_codon:yes stop_codon:yes gene_type:complete